MMENELMPELAAVSGIEQDNKTYDIHPALQMELGVPQSEPEPDLMETQPEPTVEAKSEPEQELPEPKPVEDKSQRNWRAMREQAERAKQLEREAAELARERDYYRQLADKKNEASQAEYLSATEERLAREMEELRRKIAQQEQETQKAKQQAAMSLAEQRLAQDYPDIKKVVTDENISLLQEQYPHLYNSVIASPDIYTVGSAAYEMIIAKGIYKKPKVVSDAVVQRNTAKPRSSSTVAPQATESPISKAHNFMGNTIASEDERKALYREMVQAAGNRY